MRKHGTNTLESYYPYPMDRSVMRRFRSWPYKRWKHHYRQATYLADDRGDGHDDDGGVCLVNEGRRRDDGLASSSLAGNLFPERPEQEPATLNEPPSNASIRLAPRPSLCCRQIDSAAGCVVRPNVTCSRILDALLRLEAVLIRHCQFPGRTSDHDASLAPALLHNRSATALIV